MQDMRPSSILRVVEAHPRHLGSFRELSLPHPMPGQLMLRFEKHAIRGLQEGGVPLAKRKYRQETRTLLIRPSIAVANVVPALLGKVCLQAGDLREAGSEAGLQLKAAL